MYGLGTSLTDFLLKAEVLQHIEVEGELVNRQVVLPGVVL